ncbi:MAG: methyltransferase domain-containing protein [Xanthomonadales bacterium]|nr:methyltransferase domain-containing protein [Xanthomonadales bacterium]
MPEGNGADAPGRLRRGLLFALNFFKHPRMVGTFAVSSPALVQRLLAPVDWQHCRTVVELGPGVGTITRALLAAMPANARLIAIETNTDFVRELRKTLPDPRLHVVAGSAADLAEHLQALAVASVDVVVSGIPFSTMPPPAREATLDAVARTVGDRGQFLVYQYSAMIREPLQRRFHQVHSEREWRNLVPVHLFRVSQPVAIP